MKTKISMTGLMIVVAACSTPQRGSVQILEMADGIARPEWASLTGAAPENQSHKFFLGFVEVDGDSSKSATLNMADEKAMSEPFRSFVDEFLDQNQVGEELKGSTGQRVISSTRGYRPPLPDFRIVKRYWEVVETKDSSGAIRSVLRAYSLAAVPKSEFENAKQRYLSKLSRDMQVKKVLDDVGAAQRARVLSSNSEVDR